MRKIFLMTMLSGLFTLSLTAAEDAAVDAATVDETTALADVKNVATSAFADNKSADDIARELAEKYLADNGIVEGYDANKDKSFYLGMRTVSVNAANPDFAKFRALAYDQAFSDAVAAFAAFCGKQITTQALSSLFSDNSSDAREFAEALSAGRTEIDALAEKAVAATGAKLDAALKECGVDPEQWNAAPPDQKKTLFEESFRRITLERVTKSLSGISTIMNFIGQDGKGNESIAVLIMYSPKSAELAAALRRGQRPAIAKIGKPLREQLPLNDAQKLQDLLGVRLLFDEQGPVIVSYGQWANSYAGDNASMRSSQERIASDTAQTNATAQLAEFLSANFDGKTETETGQRAAQELIKKGETGDLIEPDTAAKLINIRKTSAKRHSSAHLQGVNVLKKWKYRTPDGHEVVGVIVTYSFANMEAAKKAGAVKSATPATRQSNGTPGGRASEEQMSIDDF
ncbi:hypothetical protein FACS1894139_05900 [Planctomycetales bacterium]|nr:hypothetical protein FACS1894108_04250 [Planctomycetales bacterium]GHT04180.1 hypothetical protein FACS1894139_05900 [Planctomycetales bacterium]